MDEQFSDDTFAVPDPTGTDVVSLLKRMQQQLLFLEKKIDLLLSQSQERRSPERPFQKQSFSKSSRPFGHFRHHGKGEPERNFRDRDSAQGRPSKNRHRDEKRTFGPGKKPFLNKRRGRE